MTTPPPDSGVRAQYKTRRDAESGHAPREASYPPFGERPSWGRQQPVRRGRAHTMAAKRKHGVLRTIAERVAVLARKPAHDVEG